MMQKPSKCSGKNCEEKPTKEITYSCGPNPDQKLILCDNHYNLDPAFQRNIKTITELSK